MFDDDVAAEAAVVEAPLPADRTHDLTELVRVHVRPVDRLVLLQVVLAREPLTAHRARKRPVTW